tara:strand:+ start:103 stop:315 length:213 start_codon:yes stop_codon:yes gene_type:complete
MIRLAIWILSRALKNDPEYRRGWVANIAMAYKDRESQYRKENNLITYLNKEHRHKIANEAAENFINQLIK